MDAQSMNDRLARLREGLGVEGAADWSTVDAFWPVLERMRGDGAVVVLKLDGQRVGEDDDGPFTVVLSGGGLGDDYVRVDGRSMPAALGEAVMRYARAAWPHLAGG